MQPRWLARTGPGVPGAGLVLALVVVGGLASGQGQTLYRLVAGSEWTPGGEGPSLALRGVFRLVPQPGLLDWEQFAVDRLHFETVSEGGAPRVWRGSGFYRRGGRGPFFGQEILRLEMDDGSGPVRYVSTLRPAGADIELTLEAKEGGAALRLKAVPAWSQWLYRTVAESRFVNACIVCAGRVIPVPVSGGFELVHSGGTPLFERYQVFGLRLTDGQYLYAPPGSHVLGRDEVLIVVTPMEYADELRLTVTISFDHAAIGTQYASFTITPEVFEKELAPARTFCFFEEIEYLIKNGLIKGGSLENAVVIRDDAVLTTEPLRFPDEFVRHKVLDILGDLSLLGRPLQAHVVALLPSHAANVELGRQIAAQQRRHALALEAFSPPPPAAPATADTPVLDGAELDADQVLRMLPHRYPFLMVDRVTRISGNQISVLKNVSINEPYFQGHFPGHPIMPGVLQLEAVAQAAGILMLRQAENAGKLAYFMSAETVKWRKPVRPGDTLKIDIELTKTRGKIGKARGVCTVAGEVVSEAEVTFMLVDRP